MGRVGTYRHRVEIQRFTESRNTHGGFDRDWTRAAQWHASIQPLSGRELMSAEMAESEISHRVRCWHYAPLTTKHRILAPQNATPITAALTATATTVALSSAAAFPESGYGTYHVRVENELMTVNAGHGTVTISVTRGAYGSTATTHAALKYIERLVVLEIASIINVRERDESDEILCIERE